MFYTGNKWHHTVKDFFLCIWLQVRYFVQLKRICQTKKIKTELESASFFFLLENFIVYFVFIFQVLIFWFQNYITHNLNLFVCSTNCTCLISVLQEMNSESWLSCLYHRANCDVLWLIQRQAPSWYRLLPWIIEMLTATSAFCPTLLIHGFWSVTDEFCHGCSLICICKFCFSIFYSWTIQHLYSINILKFKGRHFQL